MLQTMRNNLQGVVAYFIVGVIIVIFAMFGVEALVQGKAPQQNAVATVNGKDVTELDVRRGMEMRKRQLTEMMGGKVDPQFLSDEFLRKPVVQGLIERRLLESAVEANKLQVDNEVIDKQIVTDKNFQQQGKFDKKYYSELLGRVGYTPASYREELKKAFLLNQFQHSLAQTSFITDKEVEELAKLQFEKRSFEYLTLPLAKALASTSASEAEVSAYYDKHKDQFLSEELAAFDYLELNKDQLLAGVQVNEQDVQTQYNAEVQAAKAKVARHAAHILIEEKPDGSHQATLKEIQQRLAKGEDFAALAKQYSVDTGSASQGGDLGETTGDSFVPEFETALAKLKVGQVSEPVKTKFGYHIIKLLGQKEPKIETLAASRPRIEADLKKQQGEELYNEKLESMRDASQGSASLADVAKQLSSTIQHHDLMPKQMMMMAFRSKAVVDAVFADSMQAGASTDVIETDKSHAIIFRLTDRKPATIKPLEQVRVQVTAMVNREKAIEALKTQAQVLQARVVAGEKIEKVARVEHLESNVMPEKGRDDNSVNAEILKKVFAMPKPDANAVNIDTLTLSSGDVVLLNVTSVQTPSADKLTAEQKGRIKEQLQSTTANHEFRALTAMLQANAKVLSKEVTSSN